MEVDGCTMYWNRHRGPKTRLPTRYRYSIRRLHSVAIMHLPGTPIVANMNRKYDAEFVQRSNSLCSFCEIQSFEGCSAYIGWSSNEAVCNALAWRFKTSGRKRRIEYQELYSVRELREFSCVPTRANLFIQSSSLQGSQISLYARNKHTYMWRFHVAIKNIDWW